ncbi:putative thiol oxidoreductase, DsbA family, FrnE subfamily [Nitrospira sp. KM1]|uniref:DsbA family oxidoreductase n=1 Tax=Nitrospira sp. KM1 TaxID=1936990 RepID=UPI0013A751FA|nr:DsbA family oxidoreductase [Nitrospira sp. KM1]BCA55247.1 putative thiol oxidoreductase, DsbA family, FrnE subfamily [Nitrospira sp. KM1]
MKTASSEFHIDIYSDVVCPWCYVGKRRLERALKLKQAAGDLRPTIAWRPFQLNPTMPEGGVDRRAYLEAKFGSMEAFEQMEGHVVEAGRSEQIDFRFDSIARTPNTALAHRLIWYAGTQRKQELMVETLFRAYFEEGCDIGARPVLVSLADRAKMDAGSVQRVLDTDEGLSEVRAEEAAGHRLGIRGVPYFVLDHAYGLSGAQPVERFLSAFEAVKAKAGAGSSGREE